MMSPELKKFYRAMQIWIVSGCPQDNPYNFQDNIGLCANVVEFSAIENIYKDLGDEMYEQFDSEGLDYCYPFNDRWGNEYVNESNVHTIYKNPKRLAWIARHAA